MSTTIKPKYEILGQLIANLRLGKALTRQSELAALLQASQQSVSRWEKGLSRPRESELRRIAVALNGDEGELFEAAGYSARTQDSKPVVISFDQPFPVNGLSPESFERFCASLLERIHKNSGGVVHQVGATGHAQGGIDVSVRGEFGLYVYQCKRVEEFGPAKVRAAMQDLTVVADRRFLLLSNIASPAARDALSGKEGWEMWDREDISRQVRLLTMQQQIQLVDTFFQGRRRELLGIPEAGPLMSSKEFFGPFLEVGRLFNHQWDLVGRKCELDLLRGAIASKDVWLTMLVGPPGGGKTRVLRQFIEELEHGLFEVYFASPTEDITVANLDRLGQGDKLLVLDDAHDRDDIAVVIRYCANPAHKTRLLLSLRAYGREKIKFQAAEFSLGGPNIREIEILRPSSDEAEALAKQVLMACNGPVEAAGAVARATFRSPLVTVVAAQIVARDEVPLNLLGNVEDFQTTVLSRFQDVIAGELVTGQDKDRIPRVLKIASLLQPFMLDDPSLLEALETIEGIAQQDSIRLLKVLTDNGLIFRRGIRYRIAPDLLSDSVITRYCVSPDKGSTGYAERVFDIARPHQLQNLLTNLGRLDWRLHDGDPKDSKLLNNIWGRLHWIDEYSTSHLEAAASVAYYQPKKALDFAAELIREGHGSESKVCEIVKYAAYNHSHLGEACDLLWHAGHGDLRPLNRYPNHGIRLLKELAEYEPNKSAEYVGVVVDFALDLAKQERWLNSPYTPFEILEGALASEGHQTSAVSRRAFTLRTYPADLNVMGEIRERIIAALLEFVHCGSLRQAFLAMQTLAEALRSPMGAVGLHALKEAQDTWGTTHEQTIQRLLETLTVSKVHPTVLVRAAESVAWHAFYGAGKSQELALRVIALLERDIDTRVCRALIDGWGSNTREIDVDSTNRPAHEIEADEIIDELTQRYEVDGLFEYMQSQLAELQTISGGHMGAPHVFMDKLIRRVNGLAEEVLVRNNRAEAGSMSPYAGTAMAVVLDKGEVASIPEDLNDLALESEALTLLAEGYSRRSESNVLSDRDIAILRLIFASHDPKVLQHVGNIALQVSKVNKLLAIDLMCSVDLVVAESARRVMFMWLCEKQVIPPELIRLDQWKKLLANLRQVSNLDDRWIGKFLKKALRIVPEEVIELGKHRILHLANRNEGFSSALGRSHSEDSNLELLQVDGGGRILLSLLEWAMALPEKGSASYLFADFIHVLCGSRNRELLDLLLNWLTGGTVLQAKVVASVLQLCDSEMMISAPTEVRALLIASHSIGKDALDEMTSALYVAFNSGVRSTTPGEPYPEDLRMRDHAQEQLARMSRMDPAYELYRDLLKAANNGIDMQMREKHAIDAEEEDVE